MREGEVTLEELATAKDSMARSLPGLFETTPESASSIGQLFVHNLPLNYYHDLPERNPEHLGCRSAAGCPEIFEAGRDGYCGGRRSKQNRAGTGETEPGPDRDPRLRRQPDRSIALDVAAGSAAFSPE